MTTIDRPTLDDVLRLARRLPSADQARLVAVLVTAFAATLADRPAAPEATADEDPWATLARLREELRVLGPVSPSITEELMTSRR